MAVALNRVPPSVRRRGLGRRLVSAYSASIASMLDRDRLLAESAFGQELIAPAIDIDLAAPLREYWLGRLAQTKSDWYAGVRIGKMPEDLRVYEQLIWIARPTVIIEIGVHFGGSALWFRDRLRTASAYGRTDNPVRVIAIDRDTAASRAAIAAADPDHGPSIVLLDGDVRDESLPDMVAGHIPEGSRCMVVEDSAHRYDTTSKALAGFARFVAPGSFFVVEDGCVDVEELRLQASWPRGVLPAISDFLQTAQGAEFRERRDLEAYGVTSAPYGFLERRAAAANAPPA